MWTDSSVSKPTETDKSDDASQILFHRRFLLHQVLHSFGCDVYFTGETQKRLSGELCPRVGRHTDGPEQSYIFG